MANQTQSLIKGQILEIGITQKNKEIQYAKFQSYWKTSQAFVLVIGMITPFIVLFRKNSAFPSQFWIYWCSITPPLTAIITFLAAHFAWKEQATKLSVQAKQLKNLQKKANLRLSTAKESDYSSLYEWLLNEVESIEAE